MLDLVRCGRSLGRDLVRRGRGLGHDLVRRECSLGHYLVRRGYSLSPDSASARNFSFFAKVQKGVTSRPPGLPTV